LRFALRMRHSPRRSPARCDGYAGAFRQPGGRLSSGPRRPAQASSRRCRTSAGLTPLSGTLWGPLSRLAAPALRRFVSRCKLRLPGVRPFGFDTMRSHVPLGGLGLGAIAGAPPETVTASLLDLEPSRSPSRRRSPVHGRRMAPSMSRRNKRRHQLNDARTGGDKCAHRFSPSSLTERHEGAYADYYGAAADSRQPSPTLRRQA